MKKLRKMSKEYYVRQIVCCWLVFYMFFCFGIPVQVAMAMPQLPQGYELLGGGSDLPDYDTSDAMFLRNIENGTIVRWNGGFNINNSQLAQFEFITDGSSIMNRDETGSMSGIYGTLNANGNVFLINPAGIVFGSGATINVNQLVASGLNMTDDAFNDTLDGVSKMVFSGGSGDVELLGDLDATGTDSLYLVGRNITNNGHISCPDGLVVMVAGDAVQLGQPGSAIIVELADLTADGDNLLVNDGTVGGSSVDKLVLAAGDVWSQAISNVKKVEIAVTGSIEADDLDGIHAEAGPGSDAVADVTISTGGDITVEGYTITAEADAEGVPDTDAIATVSITADGDVKVNADGTFTSALIEAKAENGEKNEAKVNIESTNGDVTVESEGMYEWAVIRAEAEDGIENNADITIAADGDVKVANQGGFFIILPDIDSALIEALAHEGTTNTATIDIDAGDVVEVVSNEFSFGALVRAEAWNEIEIDPDIPAPLDSEVVVVDLDTIEGLVNTATVDIDASTVEITGECAGNAAVEAIARNDIEVDIDNDDGEVAVNLTVADLVNTAGVTITANNKETADYDDGNVRVTARSLGNAGIKADAYNEIEIKHHKKADNPATMNLTLNGLVNNADVVINADDDVEVTAEDWLSDAEISAEAYNEVEVVEGYKGGDTTVNLTVNNLQNNAGIDITTAVDSVMVSGFVSGEAGIRAAVWNKLEIDESSQGGDTTLNLTVDGLVRNTADVVIDAEIDVEVKAECEGDCSEASIEALANNWLEVDLLVVEADGLVENNAGIDITAGEDVRVIAIDCGEATIAAVAENEDLDLKADGVVENNADVVINAGDDVLVQAVGGKHSKRSGFTPSQASIAALAKHANGEGSENDADVTIVATNVEVKAEEGGDAGIGATAQHIDGEDSENNADVTITTSGDVKAKASGFGSGPPSEAAIEAIAMYATNNNNAGVTITAGGNVEVAGGVDDHRGIAGIVATAEFATNNTADVTINADNVKVIAGNAEEGYKGTAEIIAEAKYAFGDDSSKNTADVTINTDGDVLVHGGIGNETAKIRAEAENGYNNTANIGIDAGGNVEVKAGNALNEHQGKAEIVAAAKYGYNNTADVTINAGGDVKVIDLYGGGNTAKIKAEADGAAYADAAITINAENVTVTSSDDGGDAEISAYANADISADASVEIFTDGDVEVTGEDAEIYADADTDNGAGNATATVTVDAENVTVTGDDDEGEGGIYADADAQNNSGNATATVVIDVGSDLTVEDNGQIQAYAYTEDGSGNATAGIDIDAGGNVNISDEGTQSNMLCDTVEAWAQALRNGSDNDPSGSALANVDIDAGGSIDIDNAGVKAFADAKGTETGTSESNIHIYTLAGGGDITIGAGSKVHAKAMTTLHETLDLPDGEELPTLASTSVDIQSCEDVIVNGMVKAHTNTKVGESEESPYYNLMGNTAADIFVKAYGDVIVNSTLDEDPEGYIMAHAHGGYENNAGVIVEAVHNVIVNDSSETSECLREGAEIFAHSNNGHTNNAFIGIATRDMIAEILDGDVIVDSGAGDIIVNGQIKALAHSCTEDEEGGPVSYNADVQISAARDVIVGGGYALYGGGGVVEVSPMILLDSRRGGQILAEASNVDRHGEGVSALENTANVDVYAGRDVIVHGAEVEYIEPFFTINGGTINGGGSYGGGQIIALTRGNGGAPKNGGLAENTSSIGIYAQRDVTIHDAIGEPPVIMLNGNGGYGDGLVLAGAHGLQSKSDADVVICAQDDVIVDGVIGAEAGTDQHLDNEHYADIWIGAGGVIAGIGWIYAEADTVALVAEASILLRTPAGDNILIEVSDEHFSVKDHANPTGDGLPDIEIGPVDCPECDFDWIDWTWCEDCEEEVFFAPVAALAQFQIPTIEGCPQLVEAAAVELGITADTIQVGIANALALNPTIQPCEACAALVDAASILRDEDGSRMAAMVQTFNTLAPAAAPFTPEMATSIAMAFEGAAEGTQYASAMEYIDAFVQYVAVLDAGMVSPVGDSVAFVMDKYGAGVTESNNANMAAFVAARLAAIGE